MNVKYSPDIRKKVLELHAKGVRAAEISKQTGVALNTIYAWQSSNGQKKFPSPVVKNAKKARANLAAVTPAKPTPITASAEVPVRAPVTDITAERIRKLEEENEMLRRLVEMFRAKAGVNLGVEL